MLIKVAWRNIWRNKKRSLIIIAAVTIGLWSGIFLMAFYHGMIEQRINTAITREISHVQLHHPEFLKDYEINYFLPDGNGLVDQIQKDAEVKAISGRIIMNGLIASPSGSSGIIINAVMPEKENNLTALKGKIIEGNYFQSQKVNEILVSEKTLQKLKLNLNKKTVLTFQDREGNLASGAFRICGIYKTINTPYDESNVFVEITDIDSLTGIPGEMNEVAILLQSNKTLESFVQRLRHQYPNVQIKSWMEISPELNLTVSAGNQMVYIFMGIILMALAFGIINTMMMAILERTREIGMLLALGMNKLKVFMMILYETFFLIAAGCPGGILFALITVAITHNKGISLSRYEEVYSSFGYESLIYPSINLNQLVTIVILVIITAVLSSLFPARRALKLKPAESIKK